MWKCFRIIHTQSFPFLPVSCLGTSVYSMSIKTHFYGYNMCWGFCVLFSEFFSTQSLFEIFLFSSFLALKLDRLQKVKIHTKKLLQLQKALHLGWPFYPCAQLLPQAVFSVQDLRQPRLALILLCYIYRRMTALLAHYFIFQTVLNCSLD